MRGLDARQVALLLATLLLSPVANLGEEASSLLETTPHFVFHSDFDTNLNDALVVADSARNKGESELIQEGAEKTCFDGLAPSARAGWNLGGKHSMHRIVAGSMTCCRI